MRRFYVKRTSGGDCEVLLCKHKGTEQYSFVNLTKGHICPCKFDSEDAALDDMRQSTNVINFYEIFI